MIVTASQRPCLVVVALVLICLASISGQGLLPQDDNTLGAGPVLAPLNALHNRALAERRKLAAGRALCGPGSGNLCSASSLSAATESYWVWSLATSPSAYSVLNTAQTGGLQPLSAPMDQGICETCVAFAVAAAADLAVAFALRRNFDQLAGISPHDLYHCNSEARQCRTGWSYRSALEMLQQRMAAGTLRTAACLPYNPDPVGLKPQQLVCEPPDPSQCAARPTAALGRFQYTALSDPVQVQRHIRNHGGVLTRIRLYPDFRPFFDATPDGIYMGPGSAGRGNGSSSSSQAMDRAGIVEHAVVVVAYDNDRRFWVLRNSWGPSFGKGGYFRVSYAAGVGILSPADTFGLRWTPSSPQAEAALLPRLTPLVNDSNCYIMQASSVDWLADVSYRLIIYDLAGLILRNSNSGLLTQLDQPPVGKGLVVCNLGLPGFQTPRAATLSSGAPPVRPSLAPNPSGQKRVLSVVGTSLPFGTTRNAPTSGARCVQRVVRVVDQRDAFLKDGPLRRVCLLTTKSNCPMVQASFGTGPLQTLGNTTAPLYTTCLDLAPQEVITGIAVAANCTVAGMLLLTNQRPGAVQLGGTWSLTTYRDALPPVPGAFVAGLSVYVDKAEMVGLRVHWGCYKSGGRCFMSA